MIVKNQSCSFEMYVRASEDDRWRILACTVDCHGVETFYLDGEPVNLATAPAQIVEMFAAMGKEIERFAWLRSQPK